MAKPKITVLSLGGTISMVQGKSGVVPGLNADDLIAAAPGIDDLAILTAESRPPVGSSDLTPEGIFDVARRVQELADSGAADGVVITQGTDSLEETSFLMDLLLDPPIPVVMMGAMRHPLAISPDGAGNLAHAVRLASDPRVAKRFRDLGVMVTMLDQAWAAVDVAKANSHRIDAFTAPETGPVAVFLEDRCRLVSFPDRAWKRAVQRSRFPRAGRSRRARRQTRRARHHRHGRGRRLAVGDGRRRRSVRLSRPGVGRPRRRPCAGAGGATAGRSFGSRAGGHGRPHGQRISVAENLWCPRLGD